MGVGVGASTAHSYHTCCTARLLSAARPDGYAGAPAQVPARGYLREPATSLPIGPLLPTGASALCIRPQQPCGAGHRLPRHRHDQGGDTGTPKAHARALVCAAQRHRCASTGAPAGRCSGRRSGKKMGNQENMPGVCVGGCVLSRTSPYSCARRGCQAAPLGMSRAPLGERRTLALRGRPTECMRGRTGRASAALL